MRTAGPAARFRAAFLAQVATPLPFVSGPATAGIIAAQAPGTSIPRPPASRAGCSPSRRAGSSCRCVRSR
ncbi:hypothetical protein GCM10009564_35630 [Streptomyces thermogriseus]|uniref:Uncharacterized protein n=1 Tax=Streptomyces thermogriseus TaxID=75292 RepID=A0ABN1T239_9ACTN